MSETTTTETGYGLRRTLGPTRSVAWLSGWDATDNPWSLYVEMADINSLEWCQKMAEHYNRPRKMVEVVALTRTITVKIGEPQP